MKYLLCLLLCFSLLVLPVSAAEDFRYDYSDYKYFSIMATAALQYSEPDMLVTYDIKDESVVSVSGWDYISATVGDVIYSFDSNSYDTSFYSDLNSSGIDLSIQDYYTAYDQHYYSYLDFYFGVRVQGASSLSYGLPSVSASVMSVPYDVGYELGPSRAYDFQVFNVGFSRSSSSSLTFIYRCTLDLVDSSAYFDSDSGQINIVIHYPFDSTILQVDFGLIAGSIGYDRQFPLSSWSPSTDPIDWGVIQSGLEGIDFGDVNIAPGSDLNFRWDVFTDVFLTSQFWLVFFMGLASVVFTCLGIRYITKKGGG